jgi:protein-disulfide isomerase
MSKKQLILVSVVVLLLLGAVGAYFALGSGGSGAGAATVGGLPPDRVTAEDHVLGNPNAPLTIIEYFAQGCSVCAHYNEAVFPQVKAKYIDTGKVRYVMRLFPLFPIDGPAYKLALCMPPQQFFSAVDLLFRNQPQWDSAEYRGVDAQAGLLKMARIMGMSEPQAQACMNSTAHDVEINKVAQEGDARYKITGTPTIVIDYKNANLQKMTWEESEAAIDAALAAKGVK